MSILFGDICGQIPMLSKTCPIIDVFSYPKFGSADAQKICTQIMTTVLRKVT